MAVEAAHLAPRFRRRRTYVVATVLLAATASVAAFYGWHEYRSREMVRELGLGPGFGNAIKHAGASADAYRALRLFGVSGGRAEAVVIRVGIVNEWAETWVKRGRPDTTLEMMRDLHNNMVGIGLARWLESHPDVTKSEGFGRLARSGVLLSSAEDLDAPPEARNQARNEQNLANAIDWFERSKSGIDATVSQALTSGAAGS